MTANVSRLWFAPVIVAVAGCAALGPASIRNGRAAYNDAIVATNNQQVLGMIVHMRYGEPSGLLAVSSVTANLHFQATAGAEFGVGPESNYEGNLTPLSAGIAYEENPTISYAPVQGETYLRQLLSPLPIDLTVLLLSALGNSPQALTLLCRSINGIQNPDFLIDAGVDTDPRFARLVELLAQLSRGGHLAWMQQTGEPPSFALALSGAGPSYVEQLGELYGLLGFPAPRDLGEVVTLPVRLGFGKPRTAAVELRTRSLFDLFNIAAASVEVPDEHLRSGLAPALPPVGAAGRSMRIVASTFCPRGALTAFRAHGRCYSIDATDTASKLTFRMLESLLSVRMADAVGRAPAPVLTVPVSR